LVILGAWIVKLLEEGGFHWERLEPGASRLKTFLRIPLVLPVLILMLVYLLATLFSVAPRISLLGSYQRLQGTYSMFSYIVIFAAIAFNLRRRAQVERLISAIVISSLPASLYGVLQRFKLDPVPWGGDVVTRIASTMGNSIFIAAYLVMVFPLTVMRIVEAYEALLLERGRTGVNFVRATLYTFILALQLFALYLSGSRGPWLGWAASLVFIGLGLSLIWRKRWLTIAGVTLALIAGSFLILLNIPNGPLESLRSQPVFARMGRLLEAESSTGLVRVLIWQGASELVTPHRPLEYPDGSKDVLNILRPLIGYGPESMYVAYHPFYPPRLGQVEKRNASPDRSHNETWDSLVITGFLGLAAYLLLFGSVLYYGLKWLGLLISARQRNLYLGLFMGGGLASALLFYFWRGKEFLGVALPFGMIIGVIIYLILTALFGSYDAPATTGQKLRAYVLLALVAALVAHWIEINFGIAIAVTRTYFWVYAGLLLLVGYILPLHEAGSASQAGSADAHLPAEGSKEARMVGKKKRRLEKNNGRETAGRQPAWLKEAWIISLLVAAMLIILGYDYISNASRSSSGLAALWSSFTQLNATSGGSSPGLLLLMGTTWLASVLLFVSESFSVGDADLPDGRSWWKMAGLGLGASLAIALLYWIAHAQFLVSLSQRTAQNIEEVMGQIRGSENILTLLYLTLFLLVGSLAAFLPIHWPAQTARRGVASWSFAAGFSLIVLGLLAYTNLRVIQADIAFKSADLFARNGNWQAAIRVYEHANDLAPHEDYYYLFLGRADLEYARSLQDEATRDDFLARSVGDLKRAQQINPLNPDHTANLARLYSLWAALYTDLEKRQERGAISDEYFQRALTLSPNSVRLWGEWALLHLNALGNPERAFELLQKALQVDPKYDWTYGLLGEYYAKYLNNDPNLTIEERGQNLIQAGTAYSQALSLAPANDVSNRYNYATGIGNVYSQLNQPEDAIQSYELALQIWPNRSDRWRLELVLARLYFQVGDMQTAQMYAQAAVTSAPEDQREGIQKLLSDLGLNVQP
jgi:tetratricopeptide (TPR) repeat protein